MKQLSTLLALATTASVLAACGGTSNNGAVPSTSQANLSTVKLQLAVGTAYNAMDTSTGINVVATLRQTDGLSGALANTPSITGPAGFSVPSGFPGAYGIDQDVGTATISSSPQVPLNQTPTNTTLGTFTGVFSYGLAPLNSDTSVSGFYPGNPNSSSSGAGGFAFSNYDPNGTLPWWPLPFGAAAAAQSIFLVGPPAVPFFANGVSQPALFAGYSPGFTAFEIAPVAGTYTMNVKVTPSNAAAVTYTATGSITSVTPLAAPVITAATENGGGLAGTVTVGAGVTETLVFINDQTAGTYYTVEVTGTGAQTWTLPANEGPCTGSINCTPTASLNTGDAYTVQAVSFDYPALEAGPPTNFSQTPTIVGAGGQADLSIGLSYPTGGGTYAKHRAAIYGKNP